MEEDGGEADEEEKSEDGEHVDGEESEESYSGDDTDDTSHSSTVGHGNNAISISIPTSPIVKDERLTVCVKGGAGLAHRRQNAFLV